MGSLLLRAVQRIEQHSDRSRACSHGVGFEEVVQSRFARLSMKGCPYLGIGEIRSGTHEKWAPTRFRRTHSARNSLFRLFNLERTIKSKSVDGSLYIAIGYVGVNECNRK